MDGGGTRMGSRSSTRYGPAAVFSGPVRRWKKRWVPIQTSSSSSSTAPSSASSSKLCLYKWTSTNGGGKDEAAEEPPPRKIRYVPVCVIEEQKKEATMEADEEDQTAEATIPPSEDLNIADVAMAPAVEPSNVHTEQST